MRWAVFTSTAASGLTGRRERFHLIKRLLIASPHAHSPAATTINWLVQSAMDKYGKRRKRADGWLVRLILPLVERHSNWVMILWSSGADVVLKEGAKEKGKERERGRAREAEREGERKRGREGQEARGRET